MGLENTAEAGNGVEAVCWLGPGQSISDDGKRDGSSRVCYRIFFSFLRTAFVGVAWKKNGVSMYNCAHRLPLLSKVLILFYSFLCGFWFSVFLIFSHPIPSQWIHAFYTSWTLIYKCIPFYTPFHSLLLFVYLVFICFFCIPDLNYLGT